MQRIRFLFLAGLCLLVALPALAQSGSASGSVQVEDDSVMVAARVEGSWSSGDPFDCARGTGALSPLDEPANVVTIWATSGVCDWRQVTLAFTVTNPPDGKLDADHDFDYSISCNETTLKLEHTLGFCDTGPCAEIPIDEGDFDFVLPNGDTINVVTTESFMTQESSSVSGAIPALGEWGAIVTGLGLAALAVFLILRRNS